MFKKITTIFLLLILFNCSKEENKTPEKVQEDQAQEQEEQIIETTTIGKRIVFSAENTIPEGLVVLNINGSIKAENLTDETINELEILVDAEDNLIFLKRPFPFDIASKGKKKVIPTIGASSTVLFLATYNSSYHRLSLTQQEQVIEEILGNNIYAELIQFINKSKVVNPLDPFIIGKISDLIAETLNSNNSQTGENQLVRVESRIDEKVITVHNPTINYVGYGIYENNVSTGTNLIAPLGQIDVNLPDNDKEYTLKFQSGERVATDLFGDLDLEELDAFEQDFLYFLERSFEFVLGPLETAGEFKLVGGFEIDETLNVSPRLKCITSIFNHFYELFDLAQSCNDKEGLLEGLKCSIDLGFIAVGETILTANECGEISLDEDTKKMLKGLGEILKAFEAGDLLGGFAVNIQDYALFQNEYTICLKTNGIGVYSCDNDLSSYVYEGGIQLKTQQEVTDFFSVNYSEITGELTIGTYEGENTTSDIYDLSMLSSLSKVKDITIINNFQLSSLQGLQNISSVDLLTIDNNNITNLNGLGGFQAINNLTIVRNNSLMNLNGLNTQLTDIGYLGIENNTNLNSLDGLNNVNSVGSNFWLTNNNSLLNLNGLENLTSIAEALRIENNLSLKSLDGLKNLNSIGSYFEITGNSSLTDFCDLQAYLSNTDLTPFIDNNKFNPTKQDIIDGNCSEGASSGEISLSDFTFSATRFTSTNPIRNYSFSQNGMHLYMSIDGDIHHYMLPSPYDLSNLNIPDEVLGLSTAQGGSSLAKDVIVNQDGTIMYVQADQSGNFNPDYFQQYSLSTPFSITSANYIDRIELNTKYNKMELSQDNSKLYIAYHDFFSTIIREIREFEFASLNDITTISVINQTPQIYENDQSASVSYDIVDGSKSIYVTDDTSSGLTKKFVMIIQGDISSIDAEQPQSAINLGSGERLVKVVGNEERFFTLVNNGGNFLINEYVRN